MQVSNNENAQTFGHVIVIRRNGLDGGKFPVNRDIMIGRHEDCHIRISLSTVSRRHTLLRIDEDEKKVYLRNMSMTNPTNLNNKSVSGLDMCLNHNDILMVGDRKFRWEYTPAFFQTFKTTVREKEEEAKRALPTPIRNDIKKRRLSTPALRVPIDNSGSDEEDEENSICSNSDDMVNINSFNLENVNHEEIKEDDVNEETDVSERRSLPTPIRAQINVQQTPTPAKGYENKIEFSTDKKHKEPKSWTPACEGMGRLFLTPQIPSAIIPTTNGIESYNITPTTFENNHQTISETQKKQEEEQAECMKEEMETKPKEIVQEQEENVEKEEERFAKESDFKFSVEYNMTCKKNDIIEALDFEENENSYFFFNAIVVGKPTKSRGVPIKFLDDKGNPIGKKRSTKYVRAMALDFNGLTETQEEKEQEDVQVQDFSTLRVVDLRAELKKLGLPTKGRKAELVDRLTKASM